MVKSSWVGSKIKMVIYIVVIMGSIGICFLGIKSNADQEQQRKIEYAQSTIKNEAVKIKRLNQRISKFYQNDQENFLVEPIAEERLKDVERDVIILKTEAIDFGLENKNLSTDTSEVMQGKQDLINKIKEIKSKRDIQKQVTALLIQAPTDWSANDVTVVIKESTSAENIAKIRNEVSETESEWSKGITAFLNEMDTQVKQYTDLKQSINTMIKDGALTSDASVEAFILNFNQLDQIKNELLKKELADSLDTIDKLLEKQSNGDVENDQEEEASPSE